MKIAISFTQAIGCLTHLDETDPGTRLSGYTLAAQHGLSSSYLLKHLRLLAAAGILRAQSGAGGGYRLARPASAVTLLDVFVAIEGPVLSFDNRAAKFSESDAIPESKVIGEVILRADRAFRETLEKTTIAEIVQEQKRLRSQTSSDDTVSV